MTAYVSLSGGLDSTATLRRAMADHFSTVAIGVDYGQRHRRELDAARNIADALGVEFRVINIEGLLTRGESLVEGGEVPHGHYAEDSMAATVVNGRNLMFVSALIGQTDPGDTVYLGVHGGDHFVYPDCRPSFVEPLAQAVAAAYDIHLVAPWINLDKTAIAASFADNPELAALTWSCYEGGDVHCGACGTCYERREAFTDALVPDLTEYATTPEYADPR